MQTLQLQPKTADPVTNNDKIEPEEIEPLKLTPPRLEVSELCFSMVEEIKVLSEQKEGKKALSAGSKELIDYFSGLGRNSSDSRSEDFPPLLEDREELPMPTPAQVCKHFDELLTTRPKHYLHTACGDWLVHELMTDLLE